MRSVITVPRSSWLLGISVLLLFSLAACSSSESTTSNSATDSEPAPAPIERPAWNQGNDTYLIRLAPERGATYTTELTQSTTNNMMVQGNAFDTEQEQTVTQTLHVADYTEDGITTLETTTDRMQVDFSAPGGQGQSYDSADSTATGPIASALAPMIDKTLRLELNQGGAFVGNRDSLTAQVDSLMGENGPDSDMLIDPILNQFRFYPSEPVAVGDSWSKEVDMNVGVPLTVDATYTLDDVTDGTATVSVAVDINTNGAPLELGQLEAEAFLSGTQSGTMTIDLESGLTQSSEMSASVSGFAEFTPPGQNQMQEIDMDINTSTSFTSTRASEATTNGDAE
ncbi:hypothetical protein CRI93_00400 [Longimonas halophila]|uniref:Lipid/polyisoprenoid-binding YceI-like domain-containing protein n=1 Tax=Longimonas halophila TaxID=1469170 RepID=A0A2H3NSM3_9BACT|nr:DUF6263 family protein [Longimonas halophila]PEN09226.1 hypothetical protein CRI93_00400 [Longimonas halophila]